MKRTQFAAAVVALLVCLSTVGVWYTGTAAASHETYAVIQSGQCVVEGVAPYQSGEDVQAFYNYRSPETSPNGSYSSYMEEHHLQRDQGSRLFLHEYQGTVSLVMIHNRRAASADTSKTSTVTFGFDGLPSGTWAVQDDDYTGQDDQFDQQQIDWFGAKGRTDGAAFQGLGNAEVTITPRFNDEAALYGEVPSGDDHYPINSWAFLSGDLGGSTTVQTNGLNMSQSVRVVQGSCAQAIQPTASVDSPETVNESETFTLDGSASTDPDGDIASYEWTIGSTTKTGETVSHSFDQAGTYNVTLRVEDEHGNADTTNATVEVVDPSQPDTTPPTVSNFSADQSDTDDRVAFSFEASERVTNVTVEVRNETGDVVHTLDERNFIESQDGDKYAYDTDLRLFGEGNYTATLTEAEDAAGNDGATDQSVTFRVATPPVAKADVPSDVTVNETFTADGRNSTNTGEADHIESFEWDFDGDGTTDATGPTANHSYSQAGEYDVTLTVADTEGETNSTTETVTVHAPDTTAPTITDFEASVGTGEFGDRLSVEFNSSEALTDVEVTVENETGDVVRTFTEDDRAYPDDTAPYSYEFNGFLPDGNYTVTLATATDASSNDGATGQNDTARVHTPPTVRVTDAPATVEAGQEFTVKTFQDENEHDELVNVTYDFGDGTTERIVDANDTETVTHAYAESGNYTITVTATGVGGDTDTATHEVTATEDDTTPTLSDFRALKGDADDDEINFAVNSSEELATPNGSRIVIANQSGAVVDDARLPYGEQRGGVWVYTSDPQLLGSGEYTATLVKAEDAAGNDGATNQTVNFTVTTPPEITNVSVPETVAVNTTFSVDARWDVTGTTEVYERATVEWDFGDNTTANTTFANHSYDETGTYDVTFAVTDEEGETTTVTRTVEVVSSFNNPPTAHINGPDSIAAGNSFSVSGHGSADADGDLAGFHWEFSDGTERDAFLVNHRFDEPGNYTVTLVVHDDDGATDTATKTITVTKTDGDEPPVADLDAPTTAAPGESVTFDASASTDDKNRIIGYKWDVDGDGEGDVVTKKPTLTRTFDEPGTYEVTVVVCDATGHEGVASVALTVEEETNEKPNDPPEDDPQQPNNDDSQPDGQSGANGNGWTVQSESQGAEQTTTDGGEQSDESGWNDGTSTTTAEQQTQQPTTDDGSQKQTDEDEQETTTATTTADATTEQPTTADDDPEETTSGGQPGFGLIVSLVAVIAAALLALRRR